MVTPGSLSRDEIRALLESKHDQYNAPQFIQDDPIQVPHRYHRREDVEIAAYLTSLITWGQRPVIIRNALRLMDSMGESPHDFLVSANKRDFSGMPPFVHRTFQREDLLHTLEVLQDLYRSEGGLEELFNVGFRRGGIRGAIENYRRRMVYGITRARMLKHYPDVGRGSASKRVNLFLMWMVRHDRSGVHFGLWKGIDPGSLMIPLDTHVGRVARMLGLLTRRTNDWMAVEELTANLRLFDPADPVRYDFSLFGLGIFDKF